MQKGEASSDPSVTCLLCSSWLHRVLANSFLPSFAHHCTAIQLTPGSLCYAQFLQALWEPPPFPRRPPLHECFVRCGFPALNTSVHICLGCNCRVTIITLISIGNSGFDIHCLTDLSVVTHELPPIWVLILHSALKQSTSSRRMASSKLSVQLYVSLVPF